MHSKFSYLLAPCLALATFIVLPWQPVCGNDTDGAESESKLLFVAARSGEGGELWSHLPQRELKAIRDKSGNTLLHEAALYGQAEIVEELLEAGLKVDAANDYGATPLMYGAGYVDVARRLIEAGADVNARSDLGSTPLVVAASYPNASSSVALLLRHGAELNARNDRQESALYRAADAGATESVRLLLAHKADLQPTRVKDPVSGEINYAWYPLNAAARSGHAEIAELLLDDGADPNGRGISFNGINIRDMTPLGWALAGNHLDVAQLLLENGADARFTAGKNRIPAVMWAAYDKAGRPEIARELLERGAPINQASDAGETALNWAEKRGATPLREFLIRHGAKKEVPTFKDKRVPRREIPKGTVARRALAQDSVETALELLLKSSSEFIQRRDCVSCHQQTIPALALGRARDKGFPMKKTGVEELVEASLEAWDGGQQESYEMQMPEPDPAYNIGYGLWGMHALDQKPNGVTKAFVFYLSRMQQAEGYIASPLFIRRPPMEDSRITGTALALRGMQLYPIDGIAREIAAQIDTGAEWLARQDSDNLTDQAFQLLALSWADAFPEKRDDLAAKLRARQRRDGGWSQLPGLRSDAWSTGLSLFALRKGFGMKTAHRAYQQGVDFLLQTQFPDGSWWVESRSWPFQRHFDSKFPHGKDQWISAPGTAWAAMALLETLDEYDPDLKEHLPANRGYGNDPTLSEQRESYSAKAKEASSLPEKITFERHIRPLFERSCAECHSGEDPKGEFRVASKEAILEGGQSGEPALAPGEPGDSKLLRLVTDQVEDMEMPPLNKRDDFPRLSSKEVSLVRNWIADGAP